MTFLPAAVTSLQSAKKAFADRMATDGSGGIERRQETTSPKRQRHFDGGGRDETDSTGSAAAARRRDARDRFE